jgi:sugar porter (SP) family MFS transporter
MGGFSRVEDRPTPKEVYNLRVYLLAITCGFGALAFGYDQAFIGTTIARTSFKSYMGMDKMTKAQNTSHTTNLTAVFGGCAFFGALSAWPSMELLGRKRPLQICSIIFNVGAAIMTAATNLGMIYAGRAITGFAVGIITAVIPTFISELSPPPIRGQLTGFFEILYQSGTLIGFWINYGISQHMNVEADSSWRLAMGAQLIFGGLLTIGTVILKESPTWLLRKGRKDEALHVLSYIRKLPEDHKYISEEVQLAQTLIDKERAMAGGKTGLGAYLKAFVGQLKLRSIRNRIVLLFCMFMLQNFSGAVVINYYSPTLFGGIGVSSADIFLYTGYYGLLKAFGAITFCFFIVDRAGRRNPWMLSAGACAVLLVYIAIFVKVAEPAKGLTSPSQIAGGKAAVAAIMLYSWFWSWGGCSLAWIVGAELFSIEMRSLTGAIGAATQWLSSFQATMSAPHMFDAIGWATFLYYGIFCFITLLFTFFWIPDTKGVPLECMGPLFDGPTRHMQFRQKAVYPPHGIPAPPTADEDDVSVHDEKDKGAFAEV